MDDDTKVCKFCFKTSSVEVIENINDENLNSLLLILNMSSSDKPVICKSCAENIRIALDFKLTCRRTEECLILFSKRNDGKRLSIIEFYSIYLSKNLDMTEIPEGFNVCRLCMELMPYDSSIALNTTKKNLISLKVILTKYLPELNLNITEDPVICLACHKSVQNYYGFVRNCLDVQEKIKEVEIGSDVEDENCQAGKSRTQKLKGNKINSIFKFNKEKLNSILKLAINSLLEEKDKSDTVDTFKSECSDEEYNPKDVEITDKLCRNEEKKEMNIKSEDITIKVEAIDVDNTSSFAASWSPGSEQIFAQYSCEKCGFQTEHEALTLIHNSTLEVMERTCNLCGHQTKYKNTFMAHMQNDTLDHENATQKLLYKCGLCTYRIKTKKSLKAHMRTHYIIPKRPTVHKCDICGYDSIHKYNFSRHMLRHYPLARAHLAKKSTSNAILLKCDTCEYESRYKSNLSRHMLIHKRVSKVTMYCCDICVYRTKYKAVLKKHMVAHAEPSE